jgi:hypothetical protein
MQQVAMLRVDLMFPIMLLEEIVVADRAPLVLEVLVQRNRYLHHHCMQMVTLVAVVVVVAVMTHIAVVLVG